jgi:hypothetical protein
VKSRKPNPEIRRKSEGRNPKAGLAGRRAFGFRSSSFRRRLFQDWPQESAENAKTRKFPAFFAFFCGRSAVWRVPVRLSALGFRLLPLIALLSLALSTNQNQVQIPDLKPPLGDLPPSLDELPRVFVQEHSQEIALLGPLAIIGILLLIRVLTPPPAPVARPGAVARRALAALADHPDAASAAEVSLHLRRFAQAEFDLPSGELTTDELLAALRRGGATPALPAELQESLAKLLRDCDALHFAPFPAAADPRLVARALEIADRLEGLRPPAAATPAAVAQSAGNSRA